MVDLFSQFSSSPSSKSRNLFFFSRLIERLGSTNSESNQLLADGDYSKQPEEKLKLEK